MDASHLIEEMSSGASLPLVVKMSITEKTLEPDCVWKIIFFHWASQTQKKKKTTGENVFFTRLDYSKNKCPLKCIIFFPTLWV